MQSYAEAGVTLKHGDPASGRVKDEPRDLRQLGYLKGEIDEVSASKIEQMIHTLLDHPRRCVAFPSWALALVRQQVILFGRAATRHLWLSLFAIAAIISPGCSSLIRPKEAPALAAAEHSAGKDRVSTVEHRRKDRQRHHFNQLVFDDKMPNDGPYSQVFQLPPEPALNGKTMIYAGYAFIENNRVPIKLLR